MIAAKAGEQLAPFLPLLVPRLYRYQFDPNLSIRQAMTSIWDALVTDKTLVVDLWLLLQNKIILAHIVSQISLCIVARDNLRVFDIIGGQVSEGDSARCHF